MPLATEVVQRLQLIFLTRTLSAWEESARYTPRVGGWLQVWKHVELQKG